MKITKEELIGIGLANGIKLSPWNVKMGIIATSFLFDIVKIIAKKLCPAVFKKYENMIENLSVEQIEDVIDFLRAYEGDVIDKIDDAPDVPGEDYGTIELKTNVSQAAHEESSDIVDKSDSTYEPVENEIPEEDNIYERKPQKKRRGNKS